MIYYFCLGTSLSLEIKSLIAETPTTYTKFYTKNAILIILLLSKYCKAQYLQAFYVIFSYFKKYRFIFNYMQVCESEGYTIYIYNIGDFISDAANVIFLLRLHGQLFSRLPTSHKPFVLFSIYKEFHHMINKYV
ncbi:hypothetical protein GLOIN_2v1702868 [Rhizophagus clarus]|uniref:Uncharacterized protein n=1 Tax=Rhizophagus clarus TaxID=94130 RepID=A0A8H3QVW4_9GLOM|nr:hypothetical protein GLOIN_2v1702868 [Rhizophagus clarus]